MLHPASHRLHPAQELVALRGLEVADVILEDLQAEREHFHEVEREIRSSSHCSAHCSKVVVTITRDEAVA